MADEEESEVPPSGADEDHEVGRRTMTREQLYALVWETPMSRLAKKFGLSDVGLRKICVKHDIPTPPLGYWGKRAHGKPLRQPPLPPAGEDEPSTFHLMIHAGRVSPPAVARAQEAALSQESKFPAIAVPSERPAKPHLVAAATAKALRAAKRDDEGFKHGQAPDSVNIAIGPESIDRALRIIDAFARAAEQRGHGIEEHDEGVRIVVDGVPMAWHIYAIKDRKPHQPTKEELEAQARREEYRTSWPDLYSPRRDTKVYQSWDYYPSDRLAMKFTDATRFRWAGKAGSAAGMIAKPKDWKTTLMMPWRRWRPARLPSITGSPRKPKRRDARRKNLNGGSANRRGASALSNDTNTCSRRRMSMPGTSGLPLLRSTWSAGSIAIQTNRSTGSSVNSERWLR